VRSTVASSPDGYAIELLRDDKTLRAVCFDNYARCLKGAVQARSGG